MALSVIGPGFGRTGTESLKTALEILGYGPCHHMVDVLPKQEQIDFWSRQSKGVQKPNWDVAFNGYKSSVDWPSAFFWRELSEYYPDAKIILSVRDPEQWYESFNKTILAYMKSEYDPESLGHLLVKNRVFAGNIEDKDHIIKTYNKNIVDVQAAFSGERLLTYHIGSGWQPLCEFLGTPVPDEPYPSMNKKEGFQEKVQQLIDSRVE